MSHPKTSALRVGSVPYLVGRPLDQGLGDEPGIELHHAVPALLIDQLRAGEIDVALVSSIELFRTPGYADHHWLARPDLDDALGAGTTQKVTDALLALDASDPDDAEILDLFGATSFVTTQNSSYDQIESVAGELGLLA